MALPFSRASTADARLNYPPLLRVRLFSWRSLDPRPLYSSRCPTTTDLRYSPLLALRSFAFLPSFVISSRSPLRPLCGPFAAPLQPDIYAYFTYIFIHIHTTGDQLLFSQYLHSLRLMLHALPSNVFIH
jgi:hypothetical protein